ncbi:Pimeloyl-ACP methyl ester carboxylesterase [Loktanella atrilutea]|uniref:Pimeloyl-ACP methyl ester carboxylesterase n=1 Tax=Loktanella atrilutea TaxID=366533 RepID=A0A1M5DB52_LOKAT|nr:alpha/beta fold hydrolase [Loktanella atrilutea]SHF64166.1 Pimeloyl-ACP methyl ester carboxylesterase [Loktanella atrilutea]
MIPLVLLPGMMCDARLYGPQVTALSGPRDVHVLPVTDHDTVQALAAAVLAAAPPRFALCGLSMGGIVAMEVLRQAPDRVDRIALLDTNPKAEAPAVQEMRAPQIAAAQAGRLAAVMRDEMKPNYLADGPDKPAILDLCMNMALTLGPEVFVRQSRALRDRPDQQDTLRAARVPALILCGAEDALCPLHRHTLMHDLMPGSTLTVIAGAGHLPTLEKPDDTTAALRRWLEDA